MKYLSSILLLSFMLSMSSCGAAERDEEWYSRKRRAMVEKQLQGRDITDSLTLKIMEKVPRHLFVPEAFRDEAYEDYPLPIGYDQTISQPYIVAYMTQALKLTGNERVLEIGAGSGYQAAVLAEICREVYTIEIVPELAKTAGEKLKELGYSKVQVFAGDGYKGLPEFAPFDAIIVTAAPVSVPRTLLEQLAVGGRMIVPVGDYFQTLCLYRKTPQGITEQDLLPVRFVPMIHGK